MNGSRAAIITFAALAVGVMFVGITISPVIAALAVGVFLLPVAFRLTVLAAATVLAMLFGSSLQAISGQSVLGSLDETLLVLFVVAAVLNRVRRGPLRTLPGSGALAVFLAFGGLSSLAQAVPVETAVLSAFLIMKGWLLAWGLAQIDWTDERIRTATCFGGWVITVAVLASAANIALGAQWSSLFGSPYEVRFGIPSVQGLFSVPLAAGNAMGCAFLLVLSHGLVHGISKRHALLLAGTAGAAGLSGRRTAVIGSAAAGMLIGIRARAASTVLFVATLLPLAVIMAWATISEALESALDVYVSRSDSARTILHRDMWDVAASHFPLGAGFGRFGSYIAGQDYSPEYVKRGYTNVWGLHESTGNSAFLTDTQWPTIVAEPGIIGGLFAVLAMVSLLRYSWLQSKSPDPSTRWVALAVASMTVLLLVASFGVPSFFGSSPPQVPLFASLGILVGRVQAWRAPQRLSVHKVTGRSGPPAGPMKVPQGF